MAQSFLSIAKFITKYSSECFLSICGEKIYLKPFWSSVTLYQI